MQAEIEKNEKENQEIALHVVILKNLITKQSDRRKYGILSSVNLSIKSASLMVIEKNRFWQMQFTTSLKVKLEELSLKEGSL